MQIVLNGEPRDVSDGVTVRALLCDLDLDKSAIAVAVNRAFVPRSEHVTYRLAAGDEIELLAPMQGG